MTKSLSERFWSKVDIRGGDECWPWLAAIKSDGYGNFFRNGKSVGAHRVAYELLNGPIPAGLVIDHVKDRGCTHRDCVNPAHLEAVTNRVNILRGSSPIAQNILKTQCSKGHGYSSMNTYITKTGHRSCIKCAREYTRLYQLKAAA